VSAPRSSENKIENPTGKIKKCTF